jgi:hypothetical protein
MSMLTSVAAGLGAVLLAGVPAGVAALTGDGGPGAPDDHVAAKESGREPGPPARARSTDGLPPGLAKRQASGKGLPPGLAKRQASGKGLPPGLAKRQASGKGLPPGLTKERKPGHEKADEAPERD